MFSIMPGARLPSFRRVMPMTAGRASSCCTAAASSTRRKAYWMGWERKRGKLHELNMLLRGDRDTSFLQGANTVPEDVQYVMTLDADTRLMRDAVTKLVGKMYHPINRPIVDPETQTGDCRLQPATAARDAVADDWQAKPRPSSASSRPIVASTPMSSPFPTSTRTSLAKAASPARASITSMLSRPRSRGGSRKMPFSATTCSKARLCAARW